MSDAQTVPLIDADSRPFWDGLDRGEVLLYECAACGMRALPLLPCCPACASPERQIVRVQGTGTVYAWIRVHRAITPRFAADVPYVVATVDLDDGCRCLGRMDAGEAMRIGMRVLPAFHQRGGWTELRFASDVADRTGARP